MANARIKRDLDDRLADRAGEVVASRHTASEADLARKERLDAFRDKWANSLTRLTESVIGRTKAWPVQCPV